jgi:hypothetical protein
MFIVLHIVLVSCLSMSPDCEWYLMSPIYIGEHVSREGSATGI